MKNAGSALISVPVALYADGGIGNTSCNSHSNILGQRYALIGPADHRSSLEDLHMKSFCSWGKVEYDGQTAASQ